MHFANNSPEQNNIYIYIPLPKDLLHIEERKFYLKKYRLLACNTNYYMGTFSPFLKGENLPPFYFLYGILSLPPHWTSQTLLNSKMSLTVFIFLIALA